MEGHRRLRGHFVRGGPDDVGTRGGRQQPAWASLPPSHGHLPDAGNVRIGRDHCHHHKLDRLSLDTCSWHTLIISRAKHYQYYLLFRDIFPDTSQWINDESMVEHCLESGWIGLCLPSNISLGPPDVPQAAPLGRFSGLRKPLVHWECPAQCIPPLGSAWMVTMM